LQQKTLMLVALVVLSIALYIKYPIYLSEGYRVVYGAESARDKTVKDRLFRNIEDAHSSRQIRERISNGLLTVVDRDLIYERCGESQAY